MFFKIIMGSFIQCKLRPMPFPESFFVLGGEVLFILVFVVLVAVALFVVFKNRSFYSPIINRIARTVLYDKEIHIAVETCLFVLEQNLSLALENIDFFYIDMKVLTENRCKTVEQGDLNLYLQNLDTVMKSGAPVVIRIPVIGSYTDDEQIHFPERAIVYRRLPSLL